MLESTALILEEQRFLLSSLSPGKAQRRLALVFVVCFFAVFILIVAGPLSGVRLRAVDAFVPAYATAMFVCDSITAILLFVQFSILRSRAILVIANGYLFTALILIPFVLVFPGIFVPGRGLLGGLQSTSWIWCVWHAGFPMFVIGYAVLKDADPSKRLGQGTVGVQIAISATITAAAVCTVGVVFTAENALLAPVASDARQFSPLWPYFIGAPVAFANVFALIVLWGRRRSMLDLWLIVVICLGLVEVPLSYYPDPERFSVGWYTVRVFGVISSCLVLVVLLYEIETLYAKLLSAVRDHQREREARLMTGDAVAASIAHEVKQPLTAMVTTADAGFRFLDRSTPNLDRAKQAFKLIAADGHRAGEVVENIRANFRNDERTRTSLDLNALIREALNLERSAIEKHRIVVHAEPNMNLPIVWGNRILLQQVLLNLITNAIDAMAAKEEPRVLSVKSETQDGDKVKVSVLDTGAGIESENIERIFNPLFTTKAKGMGMGLSICRAIIQGHDGQLWVTSNTPRGAIFSFVLRANAAAPSGA